MTMLTIKILIIINMIQLSLLYFFCDTRLGTAKRCQFSVICYFLVDASLMIFLSFPPLVQNFDSVAKTPLQQTHLI